MNALRSLLCLTLLLIASPAFGATSYYRSVIDEDQEETCPATVSTGYGTGTFELDETTKIFSYNISFGNLVGTETVSHVHLGLPGVSGGVVFGLPLGSPKIGSTAALTAGQEADLKAGKWYVNIHSTVCGSGEIRGQILVPLPNLPYE